MYLSNRDIHWAIECGQLIIDPKPDKIDPTSVDLRLDSVNEAKIWDIDAYKQNNISSGHPESELRIGRFNYAQFSRKYLKSPPDKTQAKVGDKVIKSGSSIIVKPFGFLLWQTKERVGTPEEHPNFICFVDGKSTRARTGIIVHLTAPTIHAGWSGKITLEISNLGPFDFVLEEDDIIAQLTVAKLSSTTDESLGKSFSQTANQISVSGKS